MQTIHGNAPSHGTGNPRHFGRPKTTESPFGVVLRLDLRKTRKILEQVDTSQVLLLADDKIDQKVFEALEKGHIKLMRCSWLIEQTALTVMPRRQELESREDHDLIFFPPKEAAKLFAQRDRSVLALT